MSFTSVIVVAAGSGERLKSKISKPLVKIGNKPILIYSLDTFNKLPQIDEIIVVVNKLNIEKVKQAVQRYRISKITYLVLGGKRRQDSVFNGLLTVNQKANLVLVHDGGRPFVDREIILRVINQATKSGAAIPALAVKPTIKEVDIRGKVIRTIDRSRLREIQTPQGFKKELLFIALNKFKDIDLTDDASALEKLGIAVDIVEGSNKNIKITTPEDLFIAKALLKIRK